MKASHNNRSTFGSVIFGGDSSQEKKISRNLSERETRQKSNKRSFRADVLSLLSSALRPRLLGRGGILLACLVCIFCQNAYILSASAASITLSLPDTLSLLANSANENGFSKSAPSTIKVNTDANGGYVLSIKSKDTVNKNTLMNGEFKLPSIGATLTEEAYKTGDYVNTWGFLPSKLKGADNTDFQPGPTDTDLVLDETKSATSGDASYDITIASKIDGTLPTGNYSNTFVVSAVANSNPELQNWDGCDSLGAGETVRLIDNRDAKEYNVAKLADGKCWMTENLKLGGSSPIQLTTENSNVSANWSLPATGAISQFGTSDDKTAHVYADNNGYFYNWYAATAGGTNTDGTLIALSSVCPKGWHLPTRMEFDDLKNSTENGSTLRQAPNNFTDGGYLYNSAVSSSSSGYYWGSTMGTGTGSTSSSDDLYVNTSNAGRSTMSNYEGARVRCVSGPIEYTKRSYNITYNANGGNTVSPTTGTTLDSTVSLRSASRGGYEFLGWCSLNPGSSTSCSGQTYKGSISLNTGNNNYTLYATWKSYPSASSFSCSSLSVDQSTTLNWANTTVSVRKLKDNRCWVDHGSSYETINGAYNGCVSKCSLGGFRLPSQSDYQTILNTYSSSQYIHIDTNIRPWDHWTSTRASNSQYQVIFNVVQKTFRTSSFFNFDSNQSSNTNSSNECACVKN